MTSSLRNRRTCEHRRNVWSTAILGLVTTLLFVMNLGSLAQKLVAQEKPAAVQPNQTIQFDQEKARAHMRELQDRMFRLANLIREDQPDDAARLLMGVQKAREHLIAEQMGQAAELLETLKLEQAVTEQQEIIAKLEELRRLLLTADIGLELKLEQLRQLQEARLKLGKLAAAEQQQQDDTETLRKKSDTEGLKDLEPAERRNQREGEDLQQLIKRIGPSVAAAAGAVGSASQSMSAAAGELNKSSANEAKQKQQDAIEKLHEADRSLADAEEQLRKELEALVRQQVMQLLQEMIVKQRQIRETTERLVPRIADGSAQAVIAVQRLAETEREVIAMANKCIELCEVTEFSVVFPIALTDARSKMTDVDTRLSAGLADDDIVAREQEIEADLQSLLSSLQQASKKPLNPESANGQCAGCKGNLNKLLAEFRMLRHLEESVHRQTLTLEASRAAGKISDEERTTKAETLSTRQDEVRTALDRIKKTYADPQPEPDSPMEN